MPAAAPSWLIQAWLLEKADVLLLAGLWSEACASGRQALGESLALHSKFSAGQFARWLALTPVTPEEHERALARLTDMVQELDAFDCLDQVEVLCAMQLLGSGPLTEAHRALIERNLATLPAAVTEQLTRLGMFEMTAGVA
jgi:hypothetical protein